MTEYYDHLCACGCGGRIEIQPEHKYGTGAPQYIHGHNRRGVAPSKEHRKHLSEAALSQPKGEDAKYWKHKEDCLCCVCRARRGEMRGKNASNWQGGISLQCYGEAFSEEIKNFVRERDGHTCQLCGRTEAEEGEALCVHHVDYNKKNSDPLNLISLCQRCHSKTNHNRDRWLVQIQSFFSWRFTGKILIIGDLHLTAKSPQRRKDSILETSLQKLEQVYQIARENDCSAVIQVGDFFDSPKVGNHTIASVMQSMMESGLHFFVIAGQHDITGHCLKTLPNSPLGILQSAGIVRILDEKPYTLVSEQGQDLHLYGSSFGEEVPKVENQEAFNILVTHRMIGDRPLFPGQVLEEPRTFLRGHPDYKLVLVGDYHYPFSERWGDHLMINCGALVRQTLTDLKFDLRPAVFTVTIPDLQLTRYELKIEPAEAIFDLSSPEVKHPGVLERFIEKILNSRTASEGWKSLLVRVMNEMNVNQEVKDELDSALVEAGGPR